MNFKKLSILSFVCVVACANDMPEFEWYPTLFATDSKSQSVVRELDDGSLEQISTKDKRFDKLICMPSDEPRKAQEACYVAMLKCEKWK